MGEKGELLAFLDDMIEYPQDYNLTPTGAGRAKKIKQILEDKMKKENKKIPEEIKDEYNEYLDRRNKINPITEGVLDDMLERYETLRRINRIKKQLNDLKREWQL